MNQDNLQVQSVSGLAVELPLADIGGRSVAYISDFVISLFVALGWLFLAAYIIGTAATISPIEALETVANDEGKQELCIWIGLVPAYLFFLFYHPLLEWLMKGRTPGKRLTGIRIVMQDGSETSLVPILLRNIFRLIDSLPGNYLVGLLVALFNKRHLRIGDMVAGTVLVYEEKPKKIEQYLQRHFNSDIPARELDLLIELNQRWNSLNRPQRIELAQKLLHKIGRDEVQEGGQLVEQGGQMERQGRQLDQYLRDRIRTILEG